MSNDDNGDQHLIVDTINLDCGKIQQSESSSGSSNVSDDIRLSQSKQRISTMI